VRIDSRKQTTPFPHGRHRALRRDPEARVSTSPASVSASFPGRRPPALPDQRRPHPRASRPAHRGDRGGGEEVRGGWVEGNRDGPVVVIVASFVLGGGVADAIDEELFLNREVADIIGEERFLAREVAEPVDEDIFVNVEVADRMNGQNLSIDTVADRID